jgi:ribonuclease P protein component
VQRLLKRSEFLAAARGRRFHTERMSVQGLRAPDDASPRRLRLGFTLTKKVGHATERNRIRRRLRAVAALAARPYACVPADVVVIGRREALSAPFPLLVGDLDRALAAVTKPARPAGASPGRAARPSSQRGDHA